jgi:hypothetical protein
MPPAQSILLAETLDRIRADLGVHYPADAPARD